MRPEEFNYYLPPELIAQYPIEPRDHSKMMVVRKSTGEIEHRIFYEIVDILDSNYVLVVNDSKVIPARLYGKLQESGKEVEVLLVRELEEDLWECLVRPAKKFIVGSKVFFGNSLSATVIRALTEGRRILAFDPKGILKKELDKVGVMPLPPYIKRLPNEEDKTRYQTVYAEKPGSIAAPTAGLHFTERVLNGLREKGVRILRVTLHVGPGTFRPLKKGEDVEKQRLDPEYFEILEETAQEIKKAKREGKIILAVGTTTTRALESAYDSDWKAIKRSGFTDLFIRPGYKFKIVDALLTNFHLPGSSLIMLVAALLGKELTLKAYEIAVRERYRFYSYGDCMLIIP